jgi:CubicO group peptidase (beta-lactamase class C family)
MLADALVVATVIGAPLLLFALATARRPGGWAGPLSHDLVAVMLVAQVALLAAAPAAFPRVVSSIAQEVSGDIGPAIDDGRAHEYYTAGAAGKFPDLRPPLPPHGSSPDPVSVSVLTMLLLIWLGGVLREGVRLGRRYAAARRLVREAAPLADPVVMARLDSIARALGLARRPAIAYHPALAVPAVTGVVRPTVLVPAGFAGEEPETIELALWHELAHVRRRDILVSLVSEIVVVLFWFNPLVRRGAARLRALQELAADRQVLRGGARASTYAAFLLRAVRSVANGARPSLSGLHAIVEGASIDARLRAVLDPLASRAAAPRAASVLLVGGVTLLLAAIIRAPSLLGAPRPTSQDVQAMPLRQSLLTQERLDSLVRRVIINTMADRYVAGAAVTVVHEGRLVYCAGYGRREVYHEVPVDAERTIWRIGSVTKVLTGIAVLQLVDRGLVDLDADVNSYLRDVRVPTTFAEPVRVRHLLTHTAGFDQIGLGRHAAGPAAVQSLGEFLRGNLVRIRPPGLMTTYDTYAITLAGHLVEQVTGLGYEEYLRRHLFTPLEMGRSGITLPASQAVDAAIGYGFAGSWEAAPWEYMNTAPASTVNASVSDMANLMVMLLEGGRFKSRQVLSERSAKTMLSRQFTNHPEHQGFSFTLFEDRSYGVPAFSHGGSMEGFGVFLYLVPEHRLGIFVASNQESGAVANAVLRTLTDSLFPGHPPARAQRPRVALESGAGRFAGRYANSMYHHGDPTRGWKMQPIELTVDGQGRLIFDGAPAFPVGALTFQREDGVLLTFRENAAGAITHFFVNQTVYERVPR